MDMRRLSLAAFSVALAASALAVENADPAASPCADLPGGEPLIPSWSVEVTQLRPDAYAIALQAGAFRRGGDGEALRLFRQRARQIQCEQGYAAYRIEEYSEGIANGVLIASRTAKGTIQLLTLSR